MFTKLELLALQALIDHFLDSAGKDLASKLPTHYIVMRSAQIKLREMKPVNPHAH